MISKNVFFSLLLLCTVLYGSEPPGITTRIIYYIHGDASYLFHNNDGNETNADSRILKQALCVAHASIHSEVFILHHRPQRKLLFIFPLKNLDFYYFKEGKLILENSYTNNENSAVKLEVDLVNKYGLPDQENIKSYFLFYGHKIPEDEGHGYNASQSGQSFNITVLKNALNNYAAKPFELIVLSTCKNGTHYSINQLSPLTRYILASPEDLSLYHISSVPFKVFIKNPDISTSKFINLLANYAFNKLKKQTYTMITLSVYDTQSSDNNMIKILYNPPLFGEFKNLKQHSGWGD